LRDFISTRDYRLMRRVHNWDAPAWIRAWMIGATRGGDGWLWCAAVLGVAMLGGAERFAAAGAAAVAAGAGIAVFILLKRTVCRNRPCTIEPHCWATLLPPDRFSFPSGHSITSFAVAVPLALFYPALTTGLLFCAFSIAASRIVLGMHFLSDVLAGSAIGAALGYAAYRLYM
jgi:undecaprenyl-diphosphatase